MRTLAIDCSTEACSIALFEGTRLIEGEHAVLGRGHAERLVPMIAKLPGKGKAERILVARGPGSFTGIRIGIATARALGLAWKAEVLGYPTLDLVAAQAWQPDPRPVTVCMHGGHGEWFVQNFSTSTQAQDDVRSLTPADAAAACQHSVIAGNRAQELADLLDDGHIALDMLPDARKAYLLHESQLGQNVTPIYGRAPDAKPAASGSAG